MLEIKKKSRKFVGKIQSKHTLFTCCVGIFLGEIQSKSQRTKDRVENRPVTASVRATRATKRSIQDSQQNINKSALIVNENFKQSYKRVARRTWKKRPRTFEWVLNASAPGSPVSINLLRDYCGHVACDIWENNIELQTYYFHSLLTLSASRLTPGHQQLSPIFIENWLKRLELSVPN
ncbi:Dachshund-like protein 2 [Bienertia sinuspersici]